MSFQRTKRHIALLKARGMSAQKIADELNFAGERQPRTRSLFDARTVERLISEINKG